MARIVARFADASPAAPASRRRALSSGGRVAPGESLPLPTGSPARCRRGAAEPALKAASPERLWRRGRRRGQGQSHGQTQRQNNHGRGQQEHDGEPRQCDLGCWAASPISSPRGRPDLFVSPRTSAGSSARAWLARWGRAAKIAASAQRSQRAGAEPVPGRRTCGSPSRIARRAGAHGDVGSGAPDGERNRRRCALSSLNRSRPRGFAAAGLGRQAARGRTHAHRGPAVHRHPLRAPSAAARSRGRG